MSPSSLRVALLQNSSLHESAGGIEYYQEDLLQLMVELLGPGQVLAIAPRRLSNADQKPFPQAPGIHRVRVPFHPNRYLQKIQNRFSWDYLTAARASIEAFHPGLLIAGHISLAPMTRHLSKKYGIPYAVIAYGIEVWGKQFRIYESALQSARQVISISHWTREILSRRLNRSRISVIHPHLPPAFENLAPPTPKSEDLPFTLLTVSRLSAEERYKGHDDVIQAIFRILTNRPSLKLRYIIQGDGDDKARLMEVVERHQLESVVQFRPSVANRTDFESSYRLADLFVMPSRFGQWQGRWRGEGFGIVYLEAAAFGVPTLAYACGGVTDIFSHGIQGYLAEPDNIADLARTMDSLALRRSEVAAMGMKARDHVLKNFTRKQSAQQLRAVLTQDRL